MTFCFFFWKTLKRKHFHPARPYSHCCNYLLLLCRGKNSQLYQVHKVGWQQNYYKTRGQVESAGTVTRHLWSRLWRMWHRDGISEGNVPGQCSGRLSFVRQRDCLEGSRPQINMWKWTRVYVPFRSAATSFISSWNSYHSAPALVFFFLGDQRKKLQRKGRDPTSRLGQEVEEVSAEGSSP